MTEERETECFVIHAPLGVPIILKPEKEQSNTSDHVLLVNEDYIAGKVIFITLNLLYSRLQKYLILKDSTCRKVLHYGQVFQSILLTEKMIAVSMNTIGLKTRGWRWIT